MVSPFWVPKTAAFWVIQLKKPDYSDYSRTGIEPVFNHFGRSVSGFHDRRKSSSGFWQILYGLFVFCCFAFFLIGNSNPNRELMTSPYGLLR
jgi:hypothetical protein